MRRLLALAALPCLMAAGPPLERIVIDDDFPAGYQVEVADVNGDGKPDIVGLGGGTCAWYENPTWRKRIVTGPDRTPDIISSATADIDGDGKAEIAIAYDFAMNEPRRGKLLLAVQGKGPDDPWEVGHVADVPSIHRVRWHDRSVFGGDSARVDPILPGRNPQAEGDQQQWMNLLVAPLFGPSAGPPAFQQEPAHMVEFGFRRVIKSSSPSTPKGEIAADGEVSKGGSPGRVAPPLLGKWTFSGPVGLRIGNAPVMHAIDLWRRDARDPGSILSASNLGVSHHSIASFSGAPNYVSRILVPGASGEAPKKGASEVHAGKLKDGRPFLTTVEPWHGTDVAVYLSESGDPDLKFGPRTVLDTTLVDGHALWVADIDCDGDDEIFAGYRGGKTGVNLYRREGDAWTKTVVDGAIAAQDLRGGDLDGDGRPDIVAIGGKTHNVVWYRPIGRPATPR